MSLPHAKPGKKLPRRSFLLMGTALGAGLMLGPLPVPSAAQEAAASGSGFDGFMQLSARLTGRDDLLPAQGRAAFDALSARFPDFGDGLAGLAGFLDDNDPEISGLQASLDAAGAEFAWIPRQVVSAWYLGVVGAVNPPGDVEPGLTPPADVEGTAPMQAVAWEQALMFAPLAGIIPVPSYAFRGNWAERPESGG